MKVNRHSQLNAELVAWEAAMVHDPEELIEMHARMVRRFEVHRSLEAGVWICILATAIRLCASDVLFEEA